MNYDLTRALVDVIRAVFPLYFKIGDIDIDPVHKGIQISSSAELGGIKVTGWIYYSTERYKELSKEEVISSITRRLKWNLVEEICRKFPTADWAYVSKEIVF